MTVTTSRRFTFHAKLIGAAALIALAHLFFYGEEPGWTLGGFAIAWTIVLLLRADVRASRAARGAIAMAVLFGLMRAEAQRTGTEPSAVMDRLVGLLFFYGLRQLAHGDARARGIWSLLRRPGFAPLVAELLREPAPWSRRPAGHRRPWPADAP